MTTVSSYVVGSRVPSLRIKVMVEEGALNRKV